MRNSLARDKQITLRLAAFDISSILWRKHLYKKNGVERELKYTQNSSILFWSTNEPWSVILSNDFPHVVTSKSQKVSKQISRFGPRFKLQKPLKTHWLIHGEIHENWVEIFAMRTSYWFSLCVPRGKVDRTSVDGWLSALIRFVMKKINRSTLLTEDVKGRSAHTILFLPRPGVRIEEEKNQSSLFIPHRPFPIFVFLPWRLVFRNKKKIIKVITFRLTCGLAKSQLAKKKKKTFRECVCRMANLHDNYTGNCDSRLHSSNSLYTQC